MTVLVIGATGVIGSRVTRDLLDRGEDVRAVVRTAARAGAVPGGAHAVVADLDDAGAVDRALEGMDRVVLIAANTPHQAEQEGHVIDAARRSGVVHLVKVSVGGAAPDAALALARAHWAAEVRLRESGVPSTVVRPGFFMQNLLQYAPWIAADGTWRLPLGDRPIAMVHADDVAAVVAAVAVSGLRAEDPVVTGGAALTMAEAAAVISEASGRRVSYVDGDPEQYYAHLVADGTEPGYARDLTTLYDRVVRAGWAGAVSGDVAAILQREPLTFARFAAENAAAFRAGAPAGARAG